MVQQVRGKLSRNKWEDRKLKQINRIYKEQNGTPRTEK